MAKPVWPYDEAAANQMFDRALKSYLSLHRKLASGLEYDERKSVSKKLVAAKDRLSDLNRWVDAPRKAITYPSIQSADDAGLEAISEKRSAESSRLRQAHRERHGTGALGEYNRELEVTFNSLRRKHS
jgi:hypothetical protein